MSCWTKCELMLTDIHCKGNEIKLRCEKYYTDLNMCSTIVILFSSLENEMLVIAWRYLNKEINSDNLRSPQSGTVPNHARFQGTTLTRVFGKEDGMVCQRFLISTPLNTRVIILASVPFVPDQHNTLAVFFNKHWVKNEMPFHWRFNLVGYQLWEKIPCCGCCVMYFCKHIMRSMVQLVCLLFHLVFSTSNFFSFASNILQKILKIAITAVMFLSFIVHSYNTSDACTAAGRFPRCSTRRFCYEV